MRLPLACIATLVLGACASPTTASHAPLVCDDARAGEVAFLFHTSAAFFAPYQPHGASLLVIEGSCRYHVFSWHGRAAGELRSGTLTDDELTALNAELLTADFGALDGERVNFGSGADAWTYTVRRDALEAQCYQDCARHPLLSELQVRGAQWVGRLWDRGAPLDGSVELDGYASSWSPDEVTHVAWTGTADLDALLSASTRPRVDDPADVALLRRLRSESESNQPPLFLEQGGALFEVGVADVLPFELELFADRMHPW